MFDTFFHKWYNTHFVLNLNILYTIFRMIWINNKKKFLHKASGIRSCINRKITVFPVFAICLIIFGYPKKRNREISDNQEIKKYHIAETMLIRTGHQLDKILTVGFFLYWLCFLVKMNKNVFLEFLYIVATFFNI
jgi:hypothetical protein